MLNREEKDRSYLFGRLYAVLHYMQYNSKSFNKRLPTYVEQKWSSISSLPKTFLMQADETANRYKLGLTPKEQEVCSIEIMEIYDMFEDKDFKNNSHVSNLFTFGYHLELAYLDEELK